MLEKPDCIPETWRDFITHHTSRDFFQQVVGILGPEIRKTYPFLEKRLDKTLEELSAGVRWRSACDIYLDCQIGINTPATQVSCARGVHADAREELFAILLYFKDAEDDTAGGTWRFIVGGTRRRNISWVPRRTRPPPNGSIRYPTRQIRW